MVINSWISRMILGAWHMRKMKIIIMKTTASESSFFLLMSFFFCLFWFELPRCKVTGDVTRTDAASRRVSSFSKHSCVSTHVFTSGSLADHNAVQGLNNLFVLPILVLDCCCLRAFFTEQFAFLRDLVDCPERIEGCYVPTWNMSLFLLNKLRKKAAWRVTTRLSKHMSIEDHFMFKHTAFLFVLLFK